MPGSAAIDWNLVVFNQLTIKGIYGREMYETWYKMTALIQSGLDISPVITHRFPYPQFKEAIELMKSGNSGKIVLDWSQLSSRAESAATPYLYHGARKDLIRSFLRTLPSAANCNETDVISARPPLAYAALPARAPCV